MVITNLVNFRPVSVACGLIALGLTTTESAFADAASWMYVGGGASAVQTDDSDASTHSLLQLDAGFGTTPNDALVFGGILRTLTHFSGGTDLVLAQRTATGGFARGDWGLALDVGGVQRWWGPDSTGVIGTLTGGGPWGLQLSVLASMGTNGGRMFGLSFGIDWARATAHRSVGTNWWPNRTLPLSSDKLAAER